MRFAAIWLYVCTLVLMVGCSSEPQEQQHAQQERAFLESQLAALETLAAPKGVAAADWSGLKSALATAIEQRLAEPARGNKVASDAPVSEGARPPLKYITPGGTLEWRYYNPGDYDQNGEVNISDLTPLAAHFNEAVPATPGSELTVQSVIDGDGNGLISIADITPLGANLGKRVTQYHIFAEVNGLSYPQSNGENSTIAPLLILPFSEQQGERNAERTHFAYELGEMATSTYYWVRPVDGTEGSEGTPSNQQFFNFVIPTAALSATPYSGSPPLQVLFDASPSQDGDLYSWDPEGDGTFVSSGIDPSITHAYAAAGVYPATVRVEDSNSGTVASATVAVNVASTAKWYRYALPDPPFYTIDTPLGVACGKDGGMPYVITIYQAGSSTRVNFHLATSTTGSTWADEDDMFNTTGLLRSPFTYTVGGLPAMTYEQSGNLNYNRANGSLPTAWANIHMAAGLGPSIDWYSTRTIGGNPALAYYHPGAGEVRYVSSTHWAGDTWDGPYTVETVSGSCTALTDLAGMPAIAFNDAAGSGAIKYCDSAMIVNSLIFSTPVIIGNGQCTFYDSLFTLADGSPGVVYHNMFAERVMFRRAPDSGGATWDQFDLITNTTGDPNLIPRALKVGLIPHAFWYDPVSDSLMHTSASDSSALTWSEPEVVAAAVDGSILCSPLDLDGVPAVAYVTDSNTFRFAIRY